MVNTSTYITTEPSAFGMSRCGRGSLLSFLESRVYPRYPASPPRSCCVIVFYRPRAYFIFFPLFYYIADEFACFPSSTTKHLAFILVATLGFFFTFCLFLSVSAFFGFLQYRLLAHILDSARHGGIRPAIYHWAHETYSRLGIPRSPQPLPLPTPSSSSSAAPSYEEFIFAEELKAAEKWKAAHGV